MSAPSTRYEPRVQSPRGHRRRSVRVRLFALVFFPLLLIGLLYTLLQCASYRSSATVLMSAPEAIDSTAAVASPQLAEIQRRILLSPEILDITARALQDQAPGITTATLQALLSVASVPDTNLLEMSATGPDPDILPRAVRTWTEVYSVARQQEMMRNQTRTTEQVSAELAQLDLRVGEARAALNAFREANEIVSTDGQQDAVSARLRALNEAASAALEEEYRSRARLETLQQAAERGETVVAPTQQARISAQQAELSALQAELTEARKRYTDDYIARQPQLRELPQRIAALERDLSRELQSSGQFALLEAQQSYDTAQRNRTEVEAEREAYKSEASRFSNTLAEHEALAGNLRRLEELQRDTQARLVQVESRRADRYPQVTVIEEPALIPTQVGPDYPVLLGLSLAIPLICAVLVVWLYGFLRPGESAETHITLSGVHLHGSDERDVTLAGTTQQALEGSRVPPALSDSGNTRSDPQ